jgi:thiol-disulfide isomerase/thioredoxin
MTSRTAQKKKASANPTEGRRSRSTRRGRSRSKRSNASRRYPLFAIGAVVAVVIAMVGLSVYNHAKTPVAPGSSGTAKVIAAVTTVPTAALDGVGAGEGINPPAAIDAGTPAVTSDGKPEVVYIGAEYCPYCAAERWPIVIALSRFGTFSGLGLTTSSATDVFPSTPTLTFHGSAYSSDVISFVPVETQTNQLAASGLGYESLDTLTAEEQQLMKMFDAPPYTSQAGVIPFVLIGNRFVVSGSSYPPDVLQGKTWQQIGSALSDPSSPVAKQVLAAANMLTASICELTGGQPTSVCTAPGVMSAASSLPSG